MGGQGFDCVVKAFRIGRGAKRATWPENTYLSWNKESKEIELYSPSSDSVNTWDSDYLGQDIKATEWAVYTI